MNEKLEKVNWISLMSKTFIIFPLLTFLLFVVLAIYNILPIEILVLTGLFLSLFLMLGILIPFIFKQNAIVGCTTMFAVFDFYIFIASFAFWPIMILGFIFLAVIIAILIYGKSQNKLKLYRPAKIKEKVPVDVLLNNCVKDLNEEKRPWNISISKENKSIIATIKWKDTTSFSLNNITDEIKNYKYILYLLDNYKYYETMTTNEQTTSISPGSISTNHNRFYGVTLKDYKSIEFGINHNTGETGMITTSFNTDEIRDKIRTYVEERGYRLKL